VFELHRREQYFFDPPTLARLAGFLSGYARPCVLCAPLLGREAAARGLPVRLLDLDERFAAVPGFRRFDLYRPEYLEETFDLIICDPPFFRVSLSQLFTAIRTLSHFDYAQPLLVSYLTRRGANLMGTFSRFGLAPTGFRPTYQTVDTRGRNAIEFYGNLGEAAHARLREAAP
jgi:hypothetical protein